MELLELDAGVVRRLCVNVDDPLPAVVSFGVHAFTASAVEPATLRLLATDNWNADPRELFQIPEAVAWFRRLWLEGKPLLRLLTECSADTPTEDRLGLSQMEVSTLGFGWFNVYALGMCTVEGARLEHGPEGPAWGLEMTGPATRDAVRAELLQMTPANPEGYTYHAATDRRWFMEQNAPAAIAAVRKLLADGHTDHAVLVLSVDDSAGGKLAQVLADRPGVREQIARHRAEDLHPAVVCGMERPAAAVALDAFAPEAAKHIGGGPAPNGGLWAAFVAFEGTTLAMFTGDE